MMLTTKYNVNESDCCGNGCANCVLDIKPDKSREVDKSGKQNILNKYSTFYLIDKSLHLPNLNTVWELHFKSKFYGNEAFILDINPGYHIMMRKALTAGAKKVKGNNMELRQKYLLRPYSPYWWDDMAMEFKILVHLIPNGPMSNYIDQLQINDEVEFRGPIGTFKHHSDINGEKCLLILSQGVAVAPVIAIIQDILNNENDMTRIVHIACYTDLNHLYFRDKLYNFTKYWNYKNYIFLSRQMCCNTECSENTKCLEMCPNFKTNLKYKENIKPLRLSSPELQTIISHINCKKENTFITLSGTGKFQNDFKELLQTENYGFLEDNIYLL
ncbi:hypothetical protein DOY81_005091 [Sarcophaga bullata]|nr:hypothetical protein DOY81_005091 [Sarcophaga bullata]